MNTLDYNYKLISVIRREDNFTTNKWKWFDTQVRDIFLLSWVISRSLVGYTNMGKIIGHILDNIYTLSMSLRDSIGSITSYLYTSMVIHPGSNDYLPISNYIYGNMLSSSSKKQQNRKVSLNNGILGVDYKMIINALIKYLYIYTLLYNTFISLTYLFLRRLVELSTHQL